MTAVARATSGWVSAHDPGWAALRRAARITLAACVGFFACRYGVDAPVAATYAVFGAIALGALSDVSGPPAARTRTYAAALPVGLALVAVGTAAARSTPAAVLGMLVVGFAVAYAGVGGPRVAGVANGLQLCYILPCFPPYDPGSLPARLAGLAVGIALMAAADRFVWPAPAPEAFAVRLARAAEAVAGYLAAVPAGTADAAAARVEATTGALRLGSLPVGDRPAGPGRRSRGLVHAAAELRTIVLRAQLVTAMRSRLTDVAARADTDALLVLVGDQVGRCAAALRGTGPDPKAGPLVEGVTRYLDGRAARVAELVGEVELPPVVRVGGLTAAVAESAHGLVAATRAAVGAPPDPTAPPSASAWYVDQPTPLLWWHRLRAHLTPRSVYFQNAVRLALGLAVARLAADVLDLSHGFWVLLATLSLMRTSLVASGLALVPAFLGTLGGALVAAGVLTLIGGDTTAYAAALPAVMVLAFFVGPLLGPAATQFGFTVVVAVLFAQLAPTSWRLAEARLVDVVVGGLVGALIGAAVWPRGGAGEVRRSAAAGLLLAADEIAATVRGLVGGVDRPAARRPAAFFPFTYAQYRSEPHRRSGRHDWLAMLSVLQRAASDAAALRDRYPEPDRLPWPAVAARLDTAADEVADAYRAVARAVRDRAADPPGRHLAERLDADPPRARFGDHPHDALRVLDAWGWLHGLSDDLGRAERAVVP